MNSLLTKAIDMLDVDIQELVSLDKCTLPQVRNAMNMNDNIANNTIKMMITKGGIVITIMVVGGMVFKKIEPSIVNVINAVKTPNKEDETDRKNSEEE